MIKNGAIPPFMVIVAVPLLELKQVTSVVVTVAAKELLLLEMLN